MSQLEPEEHRRHLQLELEGHHMHLQQGPGEHHRHLQLEELGERRNCLELQLEELVVLHKSQSPELVENHNCRDFQTMEPD